MGIVQRQSIPAAIITYAGIVIGYVNVILLFPQFLTTDQFGLTRVLISAALIFAQFSTLGSTYTLLRFFPYYQDRPKRHHGFLSYILLLAIAGFLFFAILMYFFRSSIQQFFQDRSPMFNEYYFYLYPLTICTILFEIFFFYARSLYKTVVPILIREVVLRLLQTGCIMLYIILPIPFDVFMMLFVATYALYLFVIMIYLAWLKQLFLYVRPSFDRGVSLRQLIRHGAFIYAASVAAIYVSNIDNILLSGMAGLTSTAVYAISFFVGSIIQVPGRTMNQIAIPIVADAWKRNDLNKLQQLYAQTSLTQLLSGGFIFLIIWINTDLLLNFLPPEYQGARWAILIVGIGKLFDLGTGINGEIILYSKHVKVNLFTNLFLMIIVTVSNILLIPLYGVEGSALALAISLFSFNVIRMGFLYYRYRMQPFSFNTVKALLLIMVVFVPLFLVPGLQNAWLDATVKTLFLGSMFIITALYLKISPEINAAWIQFRSVLSARR